VKKALHTFTDHRYAKRCHRAPQHPGLYECEALHWHLHNNVVRNMVVGQGIGSDAKPASEEGNEDGGGNRDIIHENRFVAIF